MDREFMKKMYEENQLSKDDVYKHKHYVIITRSGIEKIQAKSNIQIKYEVIVCERDYAVFKAIATMGDKVIETFGSALRGKKEREKFDKEINGKKGKRIEHGNTETWYIAEMAEKRAMSRAVLKLSGLYEHGVFGEDESEDFTSKDNQQG